MLKQVRKSGAAGNLTVRTDVVVNGNRNDRVRLILVKDYVQTVI